MNGLTIKRPETLLGVIFVIIDSRNSFAPIWRQAISSSNDDFRYIFTQRTNSGKLFQIFYCILLYILLSQSQN